MVPWCQSYNEVCRQIDVHDCIIDYFVWFVNELAEELI